MNTVEDRHSGLNVCVGRIGAETTTFRSLRDELGSQHPSVYWSRP